jgi:hypothetical protein
VDVHVVPAPDRVEVDALIRHLLATEKDPAKALIDEEIVRRRLTLI